MLEVVKFSSTGWSNPCTTQTKAPRFGRRRDATIRAKGRTAISHQTGPIVPVVADNS